MKRLLWVVALGLILALSGSASAEKPLFANVSADAQCTLTGTDLMVDAGLIQKDTPSSGPIVSTVVFSLEQHFANQPKWEGVGGSEVIVGVNHGFDLLAAGERYDVALNTYAPVCSQAISSDANAVRAVVEITVDNANDQRPGGKVFTGRCISIPNPCR